MIGLEILDSLKRSMQLKSRFCEGKGGSWNLKSSSQWDSGAFKIYLINCVLFILEFLEPTTVPST